MIATPGITDESTTVGPPLPTRRRRRALVPLMVLVLVALALGVAAAMANASLSRQYSPQAAVRSYFAAQQRGDVAGMWANAAFERPDGAYSRFFDRGALAGMMRIGANSTLGDVRILATQDVDASTKAITVTMLWDGVRRTEQLRVRRDQSNVHWLLYPSWTVQVPSITVQLKLPNQPGAVSLDGIPAPVTSQTILYTIRGFHEVSIDSTALLAGSHARVDARDQLATATLPGTLAEARVSDAGTALKKAFDSCDVSKYDGCFNHTYLARDNNFIYYMTVPGYGDVNYTKYSYALVGDPTTGMTITVEPQPGDVSVSGTCASTLTVNGSRSFKLKGEFSGKLHWSGGDFSSDVTWDCTKTRA